MKYIAIIPIILFSGSSAFAKNIRLDNNENNCKKVDGFGKNDAMAIASKYKVPLSSVKFVEARWQRGEFGSFTCVFIFDTAKGPKKCTPNELLSDDNGKTAFGSVAAYGHAVCFE